MEKFFYVSTGPVASNKFTTYEEAEKFAKRKVQGETKAWIMEAIAVAQAPIPTAEITKF